MAAQALALVLCVTLLTGDTPPQASDRVHAMIAVLSDEKASETSKLEVTKALIELGPDSKEAVPALIKLLEVPSVPLRIAAADTLASIGPEARDAVDALSKALADNSSIPFEDKNTVGLGPSVRHSAALALCAMGPEALASARPLLDAIRDDTWPIRWNDYIRALTRIGPKAIPALTTAIREGKPHVRASSVDALVGMRERAAPGIPVLIESLGTSNFMPSGHLPGVVQDCSKTLIELDPLGRREIRGGLSHPDRVVRVKCAAILSKVEPTAKDYLPVLIEGLKFEKTREVAARALAAMGPRASEAVPILEREARARSFRLAGVGALAQIDPKNPMVVQALDRFERQRRDANPPGLPAARPMTPLERFERQISGANEDTRWYWAIAGLRRHFGSAAVPLLCKALSDADEDIRGHAIEALEALGERASAAIPKLLDIIKVSENREARDNSTEVWQAAMAIRAIEPTLSKTTRDAAPALVKSLVKNSDFMKDDDGLLLIAQFGRHAVGPLRHALGDPGQEPDNGPKKAAMVLGMIGPDASEAVPSMIEAFGRFDVEGRQVTIEALGKIGPGAAQAIPVIAGTLKTDPDTAIEALSRIGEAAVPTLVQLLDDQDPRRRKITLEALATMGPRANAAFPSILALASVKSPERRYALLVLGNLRPCPESESVLILATWDQEQAVRAAACQALGNLGSKSEAVIQALLPATKDPAFHVRLRAIEALGTLKVSNNGEVERALRLASSDSYQAIRDAAELALHVPPPR